MVQVKRYRCIELCQSFVLLLFFNNTYALEPIISSFAFTRLIQPEVRQLKNYLHQIEDTNKRHLKPRQIKSIIHHFDRGKIYRKQSQELVKARQAFQRRKIMITADWCYYTHEKMPDLAPILLNNDLDDIQITPEDTWDLHHIIFLRLNGQNEWWNIIPIPRKEHHSVIHRKDQPGEILHKMLEERFHHNDEPPL